MNDVLAERYRIDQEIARGAAGVVHRARDLITDDDVAVKILHAEAVAEPVISAAFLDEAEVLAELNHPNIVRPRDLIVTGAVMALVMDYVDGVDLRRYLLEDGPLSPRAAARLAIDIADALAAVHAADIIHGDVKPGNILISNNSTVVHLIDFGIARRIATPDAPTHGTPDYTAPEIVRGLGSSAKSDIYGLGLVLFEMLCVRNPYRGGGVDEVLGRQAEKIPVRPSSVPVEIWNVIELCLDADPAARPEPAALVLMLRAIMEQLPDEPGAALVDPPQLRDRGPSVAPAPAAVTGLMPFMELPEARTAARPRRSAVFAGAAAAVAAIALVGSLIFMNQSNDTSPVESTRSEDQTNQTIEPTATTPSPSTDSPSESPASPDGDELDPGSDSNGDDGADDPWVDNPAPGDTVPDVPGGEYLGSPMPGRNGNG